MLKLTIIPPIKLLTANKKNCNKYLKENGKLAKISRTTFKIQHV